MGYTKNRKEGVVNIIKRWHKVILAGCTLFNILLLLLSAYLFYCRAGESEWGPPVRAQVSPHADIGYMRINSTSPNQINNPPEYVEYELLEYTPGDPAGQSDTLTIQRTVLATVPENAGSDPGSLYGKINWYCEEDGYWYHIFSPNFFARMCYVPLQPGEKILTCSVPSDVLARPGKYNMEFFELGSCTFEIQ